MPTRSAIRTPPGGRSRGPRGILRQWSVIAGITMLGAIGAAPAIAAGLTPTTVVGTVTAAGSPIVGARVEFVPAGPDRTSSATATTDTSGRFALAVQPTTGRRGAGWIVVGGSETAVQPAVFISGGLSYTTTMLGSAASLGGTAAPPPAIDISDLAGLPELHIDVDRTAQVSGADVRAAHATVTLSTQGGAVIATTTADADGAYVIPAVGPGRYVLGTTPAAAAPGTARTTVGLQLAPGQAVIAPPPPPAVTTTLRGTLVRGSHRVHGTLVARTATGATVLLQVHRGRFLVRGLPAGRVTLTAVRGARLASESVVLRLGAVKRVVLHLQIPTAAPAPTQ